MRHALKHILAAGLIALALSALVGAGTAQAQQGQINVTFTPRDTTVAPGTDFWIGFDVTSATAGYNGWEAVLTFDPSRVQYVPTSPLAAQQGCLMVGTCSDALGHSACGTTWIEVTPAADSVYTFDGLLCNQVYLTGPGRLIRYHFRALSTAGATSIQLRRSSFVNSTWLNPGTSSGPATIHIGTGSTAVDPPSAARGLAVTATPNPSHGAVTLALQAEGSGEQEVAIHDVSGRLVRMVSHAWQAAGSRQVVWDGLDESGSRVAPGVYLVTLRVGNRQTQSRITLLQ